MPFFSKVFSSSSLNEKRNKASLQRTSQPASAVHRPSWDDAWTRQEVEPEEVQELLHVCTQELKSRALDTPFVLLPFRPNSEPNAARTFIRSYFRSGQELSTRHKQERFYELRLIEPTVLCSIMKWCWSRLRGGVVTWGAYELFRVGEKESRMAKSAFDTFIPLSVTSEARTKIIYSFFDLLAAVAANSKKNGLGGRKLSRLAGWWAFEQVDEGRGFDACYRSWIGAADASSHLFFAYLRARAPDPTSTTTSISQLSRSLQVLVSSTEYPPQVPAILQSDASRMAVTVETFSTSPFSLLQRAQHLQSHGKKSGLEELSGRDDPSMALTDECRRVVNAISGRDQVIQQTSDAAATDTPSWTRFEDVGFATMLNGGDGAVVEKTVPGERASTSSSRPTTISVSKEPPRAVTNSWSDFMESGFTTDYEQGTSTVLTPPDKVLPRLHADTLPPATAATSSGAATGEVQYVKSINLEETFWWVWMTSLAGEEPAVRKTIFNKCAVLEMQAAAERWLVIEEQMKIRSYAQEMPSSPLTTKRSRFGFMKRNRTSQSVENLRPSTSPAISRLASSRAIEISPEQRSRVHTAAVSLVASHNARAAAEVLSKQTSARSDDNTHRLSSTTSMMNLTKNFQTDSAAAMQWDRKFEQESTKAKYLEDPSAGKGYPRDQSPVDHASVRRPVSTIANTTSIPELYERHLPAVPTSVQSIPASSTAYNTTSVSDLPPTLPEISDFDSQDLTPRLISQSFDAPAIPNLVHTAPTTAPETTHAENRYTSAHSIVNGNGAQSRHLKPSQEPMDILRARYLSQGNDDGAFLSPLDRVASLEKSKTGSVRGLRNMFRRRQIDDASPSPPKPQSPAPLSAPPERMHPQPQAQPDATHKPTRNSLLQAEPQSTARSSRAPSRRTSLHSRQTMRPQKPDQGNMPPPPLPAPPSRSNVTHQPSSAMMAAQAAMNSVNKKSNPQLDVQGANSAGSSRVSLSRASSVNRRHTQSDSLAARPTTLPHMGAETANIGATRRPVATARSDTGSTATRDPAVRKDSVGARVKYDQYGTTAAASAAAGTLLLGAAAANTPRKQKRHSTPVFRTAESFPSFEDSIGSALAQRNVSSHAQQTLHSTTSLQSFQPRSAAAVEAAPAPLPLLSSALYVDAAMVASGQDNQRLHDMNSGRQMPDGIYDSTSDYSFDLARQSSLRQPAHAPTAGVLALSQSTSVQPGPYHSSLPPAIHSGLYTSSHTGSYIPTATTTTMTTTTPAPALHNGVTAVRANGYSDAHQRSYSGGNDSNGSSDVTGEHAVEVRVARIKARVAELTGTTPAHAHQAAGGVR